MIVLIVSSLKEIEYFHSKLNINRCYSVNNLQVYEGVIGQNDIKIIISGVGIKNARSASNFALNNLKSKKVYVAGICGGLDPGLMIGDIVSGKWVYSTQKDKRINLGKVKDADLHDIKTGGILSNNRFISKSSQKQELFLKSGALVVDMETWGAAEICYKSGIEICAIRSVSDLNTDSLPDLGYIYGAKDTLDKWKTITYFSKNPYLFYKYLEFRFINFKKASCSLSHFLLKLFGN